MKLVLAFALVAVAASSSAPKLRLNKDGATVDLTWDGSILTVPQHCRASTCTAQDNRIVSLEAAVTAQVAENKALHGLVAHLTTRLAALEGTHTSDHAAMDNEMDALESAYKKADTALQQAISTISLTPGAKGDQGDQGIQGTQGDNGEKGNPGTDGKNAASGAHGTFVATGTYTFVESNVMCASTQHYFSLPSCSFYNLQECADKCRATPGCKFFQHGKGWNGCGSNQRHYPSSETLPYSSSTPLGHCFWAKTLTQNCNEGWTVNNKYNFYKLN